MVSLMSLWLPILVSAVLVFFAASIAWMVLPHHKKDYGKLAEEDAVREAINKGDNPAGMYVIPYCPDMKAMEDPEIKKKMEEGPKGFLTLRDPGYDPQKGMGACLVIYFLYNLAVSFFCAYLASRFLGPGADYLTVFQVVGTAAFMAYAFAVVPTAIWKGVPWTVVWKEVFDGLVYGLLTAGAFGWLWPS